MDFDIEQRYATGPDAVARAYVEPGLYELIGDASSLGRPEVLDISVDGDTARVELRYRFTGELNAAARAALDPGRLTWVERSAHDLARHVVEFRLVPDHYGDRFTASGQATVVARGPGSARRVTGALRVKAPLVGRAVEKAIVSGLRDHLAAEAEAVDRFLAAGTEGA